MQVTDEMVNRFLCWPLPKTFAPDCGISFDGRKDDQYNKNKTWPVGTNLLNALEARAMLEHVLRGELDDAARMRWLLAGNGYFLEEEMLCGHSPCSIEEQAVARGKIDAAMAARD